VQVYEHHAQRDTAALTPKDRVAQVLAEQGAIGQPGQGVMKGLVAQLFFESFLGRYVATVEHQPGHARLV
jgi:hypothetical protein